MDILIITVLIIAAALLLLVELFLVPGISLAGLGALACIVYANYYAFVHLGTAGGFITLLISAIVCIGALVWFMRSKTLDRLALKKEVDWKVNPTGNERMSERRVRVGDTGISVTRLAQIGSAEFNGNVVEVRSIDGFVDEKTPVVVRRINDGIIMVEKLEIVKE
ncbi:MAG: NfeD family protein [Mediterranea sp.]|jgi:membrane-bound ClpP family serine protease|nr:NfeD family protein [Mediterranea sp.]